MITLTFHLTPEDESENQPSSYNFECRYYEDEEGRGDENTDMMRHYAQMAAQMAEDVAAKLYARSGAMQEPATPEAGNAVFRLHFMPGEEADEDFEDPEDLSPVPLDRVSMKLVVSNLSALGVMETPPAVVATMVADLMKTHLDVHAIPMASAH